MPVDRTAGKESKALGEDRAIISRKLEPAVFDAEIDFAELVHDAPVESTAPAR